MKTLASDISASLFYPVALKQRLQAQIDNACAFGVWHRFIRLRAFSCGRVKTLLGRSLISCFFVNLSFCFNLSIIPGPLVFKLFKNYSGIKLVWATSWKKHKCEILSLSAHVVHTTAKQVISRWGKNENDREMYKNEKRGRAKRPKLLFFVAKYATLWRSCRPRRFGCLSYVMVQLWPVCLHFESAQFLRV